jgi:hypothetical protein
MFTQITVCKHDALGPHEVLASIVLSHDKRRRAMNRRWFEKTLVVIVACVTLAIGVPAVAQELVQIDGRVSFVSGQRMVVAPPGGLPVTIDLSGVDQDQYQALVAGERVVVTGVLTPERNRVVATAVQRVAS